MNKIGIFIFIFSTLVSGLFVFSSLEVSERGLIPTQAEITSETGYFENYYDGRYVCTAEINFRYNAEGDLTIYSGFVQGSMESSSSCIDQIEQAYPVGSYIDIYYWSDDPSTYEFQNLVGDEAFMYNCCAFFFGIFAVSGIAMAFLGGNVKTSMATGGLAGRMGLSQPTNNRMQGGQTRNDNQHINHGMVNQNSYRSRNTGHLGYKERNYNSVIDRLGLHGMTEQQVRAAVNKSGFMTSDSADLFFNNEHVKKTLGLTSYSQVENTVSSSLKTPKTNFWTTASTPTTIDGGPEDECGHIGCSKKVNSFDFRCFECRKRFCDDHRGATFKCASCDD